METKKEIVFADGLRFERPTPNAPEFIKGRMSFNVEQFKAFLDKHKNLRGYVNCDLKLGKSGSLYVSLNDWVKPEGLKKEPEEGRTYRSSLEGVVEYPEPKGRTAFDDLEINPEDVPF